MVGSCTRSASCSAPSSSMSVVVQSSRTSVTATWSAMPKVRSRSEKRSPSPTASEPTAAPATTRSSSSASRSTRSRRASRCSRVNTSGDASSAPSSRGRCEPPSALTGGLAPRRGTRYSEPNGSVSHDRRPRLCSPRRPDSPDRPRTARRRQRDDQRTRRALRHVADRNEEACPAARGGAARHDGEGRPCPHVHARALRLRGHQHVVAAARPLREGRRTNERRSMSTTAKKGKQQAAKFTAEEKAAMRARARELKAAEDGESAVRDALAEMSPKDRALGKRIHAIVTESAPELTPKTWYGMPAYANKDGKVVCFFRNAGKFKERYAMFGFNDSANLDEGSMWPIAYALTELTAADEAKIRKLVKRAVS